MKVALSVGTRPEIIKMASVVQELNTDPDIELFLIHTGQHYDWEMSDRFFNEIGFPRPDAYMGVGSGTHMEQISKILARSEDLLGKATPDVVVVEGDTNSAFGVSLAAAKLGIPVAHVEAGCRSFDRKMPEEQNRVAISHIASIHFAPTARCQKNLIKEGIPNERIFLTGHPIVDTVSKLQPAIESCDVLERLNLVKGNYYFMTCHREENVDNLANLTKILDGIRQVSLRRPVVFPIHPRTKQRLSQLGSTSLTDRIRAIQPTGYTETLSLIKNATLILTDSGGIQQEAFLLRTPCITLRQTTEWPETVECGVNFLASQFPASIVSVTDKIEGSLSKILSRFDMAGNPFGAVGVSKQIAKFLPRVLQTVGVG